MSDKPRTYGWAGLPEEVQRLEAQAKSMEAILNRELQIMKLTSNQRILDAGCGSGAVTRKIAQHVSPGEAVGIDIDPIFLENAKKLAENEGIKNIRFKLGNIDNLSYEDEYFDGSYCRLVLMHVNDPVHSVGELARVTKRGGFVAVADNDDGVVISYPHAPKFQKLWRLYGQRAKEKGENRYIGRELYSIFSEAGLGSIQIFPFPMFATQDNPEVLRGLVSIPMEIIAISKDDMVDEGRFSEKEYLEMVEEVEETLSHPGGFAMGMSFFAVGVK
jgi:ubiquinone/menaquinone biosynthesis C-methylase UbiE